MGYGYGGWAPYVPVAERRRRAEREMAKLRKKGHPVSPVRIEGRTIARTFWGKAWCDNLESYRDYENRLPRGRTYVRNGSVVDLQVAPRQVTAMVSGSEIYTVTISITAVPEARWRSLCQGCGGGIDTLVELLQGRFSKAVMERLCRQDTGLFPTPSEIRFSCTCPDAAWMCKHVAAVLYGVGARLDETPELLFRLRDVDEKELLASVDPAVPLTRTEPAAANVLADEDLSALFGLDMAGEESPAAPSGGAPASKPRAPRRRRDSGAPAMAVSDGDSPQGAAKKAGPRKKAKRVLGASVAPAAPQTDQRPRRRKRGAVWDPADIYEP